MKFHIDCWFKFYSLRTQWLKDISLPLQVPSTLYTAAQKLVLTSTAASITKLNMWTFSGQFPRPWFLRICQITMGLASGHQMTRFSRPRWKKSNIKGKVYQLINWYVNTTFGCRIRHDSHCGPGTHLLFTVLAPSIIGGRLFDTGDSRIATKQEAFIGAARVKTTTCACLPKAG